MGLKLRILLAVRVEEIAQQSSALSSELNQVRCIGHLFQSH